MATVTTMSEFDQYRYEVGEMIIDAVMEGRFEAMFDTSFQVVFGYFPPEPRWRERFERETQFRVWRTKTLKRYLAWIWKQNYPNNEKLHVSSQFYHAIGQEPDPEWVKRHAK